MNAFWTLFTLFNLLFQLIHFSLIFKIFSSSTDLAFIWPGITLKCLFGDISALSFLNSGTETKRMQNYFTLEKLLLTKKLFTF